MSDLHSNSAQPIDDEAPPLLGTWRRVYIFVLVYLAAVILALYFISRALAE